MANQLQPPIEVTGQRGEKGMWNSVGLQHCFLNTVIQSLWHLGSFRERFVRLAHHQHRRAGLLHDYVGIEPTHDTDIQHVTHADAQPEEAGEIQDDTDEPMDQATKMTTTRGSGGSDSPAPGSSLDDSSTCVCCALKLIFVHYEHSDATIIPPDTLRFALSLLLDNTGANMFALKEMSDAEEALDAILKYLHWDCVGAANVPPPSVKQGQAEESEISRSLDVACHPTCVSHQVFGNQLMDQRVCSACGATSDPEMSNTFLYRIYVSEIVRVARQQPKWALENILRANYLTQAYSCPFPQKSTRGPKGEQVFRKCPGPAKIERFLLSLPEVFSMMCVWANADTDRSEIAAFFAVIPMELHLDRFLQVQPGETPQTGRNGSTALYKFRGMILYYGKHYLSIYYSAQFASFIMFDDKRVTRVGDWPAVVDRCCRGKLQPTVLFYESCSPEVQARLQHDIQAADRESDQLRKAEERLMAEQTAEALRLSAVSGVPIVQQSPPNGRPTAHATVIGAPPSAAASSSAVPRQQQPQQVAYNPTPLPTLSPTTVRTHTFFSISSGSAHQHIIPAPVASSSSPTDAAHGTTQIYRHDQPTSIITDYVSTKSGAGGAGVAASSSSASASSASAPTPDLFKDWIFASDQTNQPQSQPQQAYASPKPMMPDHAAKLMQSGQIFGLPPKR